MKKRIDPLTIEEEEEFRSYISVYQRKKIITKEMAQKMLKEGKNGAIMCSLYFDFIEADDPDRFFFTSLDEDEIAIGKIQKVKKKQTDNLIQFLPENLEKLRCFSQELRQTNDEDENETDKANIQKFYVYTFVFRRVASTCLIYLNSPPKERSSVDINSRFYYVQQNLDNLNYDEQERFKDYIKRASELVSYKRNTMINFPDMYDFLKRETNGAILKDLIYKFLKKDNRDLFWAINPEDDEIGIGKINKRQRKVGKRVVVVLRDHLNLVKRHFEKLEMK